MVDVSSIETLNEELPRIPKILANSKRFLINVLGCKVLSDTAVVRVTQFGLVAALVKQVVDVDVVDIASDLLQLWIRLRLFILFTCFIVTLRVFFICFFKPLMRQHLWD